MYEMRRAVQRRGLPELEELTDELVSSAKGGNLTVKRENHAISFACPLVCGA